jgi:hypothetical protein
MEKSARSKTVKILVMDDNESGYTIVNCTTNELEEGLSRDDVLAVLAKFRDSKKLTMIEQPIMGFWRCTM